MSDYTAIAGDTWESISRKVYGTEQLAALLQSSNSWVSEPIQSGAQIITPQNSLSPVNSLQQAPSNGQNEVSLFLNGSRFRYWSKITIARTIDSMDTISVVAPFDAEDQEYRAAFRPFSFDPVEVNVNGFPLFTGVTVSTKPDLDNTGSTVGINAYSKPGLLHDCTAPGAKAPLEFQGQNLRGIAESLCAPFGISVEFEADPGPIFDKPISMKENKPVLSFLTKLAKQRNLVVSSTARGALLFRRSISVETTPPVAILTQGSSPLVKVSAEFNEQEYYSSVTGVEPSFLFFDGKQITVKNPYLTKVQRPLVFTASDTQGGDLQTAVNAKIGRMFANMASYSVDVCTWRDPAGNLWEPNTVVKLRAPSAMIYDEYAFIIRSVRLERTSEAETAVLNLMLPGGFSGEIPGRLPWG